MLMMSRAAQTHLAGLMRPAGRVFETPDLVGVITQLSFNVASHNDFEAKLFCSTNFDLLISLGFKLKIKIYLYLIEHTKYKQIKHFRNS